MDPRNSQTPKMTTEKHTNALKPGPNPETHKPNLEAHHLYKSYRLK
jgi:hypothetical protein